MTNETVLAEATFNRKVRTYWLFFGSILCVVTLIGIVFLPFWLLFGHLLTERHLRHMSCTLTERSLKVTRGIWVRQEKTVPLDKITDLALVEGPLMRHYGLQAISVETAGQSTPGSLVRLIGIDGAREFRDRVLAQRDLVMEGAAGTIALETGATPGGDPDVLEEIRDTLLRIEARLPEG
jgi:putative membrane protein